MEKIKIILVDDHEIFRNGVKELVDKEADMEVIGEASNGLEAIQLTSSLNPDLLIMDIRMPSLNGIEASEELLKKNPALKIIIFSLYDNEEYVTQALKLGATGYLLKDTSNKIFLDAIRAVKDGEFYYIGEVSDIVIRHFRESGGYSSPSPASPKAQLSKRETEILELISEGNNSKETADRLGVSVRTVDAHRLNILRKFAANNIEEVLSVYQKD